MRTRIASLTLALFLAGCGGDDAPSADQAVVEDTRAAPQTSLYERLGGIDAITSVVDTFIAKSAADARINQKFAKSNMPRLRFHLIEQVCAVTRGPCEYTGRDMRSTHAKMGVTDGEFDALVENLVATLDQFKVPEPEKNELLAILGPLRPEIVETTGPKTGTPLPASFQPAPPLPAEKLQAGPVRP